MASHSSMSGMMSDYARLRTLPALLSVVFVAAGLYQFGGIQEIHITWIDYTLSTSHATIVSLLVFVAAFASSETKSLDHYEDWEMATIAAGPILIVAHQYWGYVSDQFAAHDPTLPIIGFVITVAAWGVAVR